MNNKLSIQDLASAFAEKVDMDAKSANIFVKTVFEIVEEYIATDKIVKIKGFGTFKLISVSDRESVNVNTGERIIIAGHTKLSFTPDAALYTANQLRKKGADIYIYNGGFHHSKIMMIDSLYCTVGSTNLNSRSLRFDYEVNAFVFDKETTYELIQMFQEDKEDSTLLTAEMYKKRTTWKKFIGWFAHLFTPFL